MRHPDRLRQEKAAQKAILFARSWVSAALQRCLSQRLSLCLDVREARGHQRHQEPPLQHAARHKGAAEDRPRHGIHSLVAARSCEDELHVTAWVHVVFTWRGLALLLLPQQVFPHPQVRQVLLELLDCRLNLTFCRRSGRQDQAGDTFEYVGSKDEGRPQPIDELALLRRYGRVMADGGAQDFLPGPLGQEALLVIEERFSDLE